MLSNKNERLYGQTITSPTWGTSPKRVTSPTWGPPDLHVNRPLDPVTNYMAGAFIQKVILHVIGPNRLINEHNPITKSHVSFLWQNVVVTMHDTDSCPQNGD